MPCLEPTRRKHCIVASVIMSHQRSQHLRCTSSDVSSTQLPASPCFSYLQLLKIKTSSQQLDQNFSRSFPRFCCPEDQDLPSSALLWAPTRTGTFRHLVLLTWFCSRLKRRYGLGQQVTGCVLEVCKALWHVSKGMVQKGSKVPPQLHYQCAVTCPGINVLWQHLLLQQAIHLRIVFFITFCGLVLCLNR